MNKCKEVDGINCSGFKVCVKWLCKASAAEVETKHIIHHKTLKRFPPLYNLQVWEFI
jgi:hypothetical protein